MNSNLSCINLEKLDKTQIVDGLELDTILSCGGILMADSKNPTNENIYVVYIDTGRLKITKIKL